MKFEKYINILPEVPGIQGKEEYFNSSILVLMTEIAGEDCFVLERRNLSISQGGEICFPGGKIDKSDLNELQTSLRETHEELGILESEIEIIGRMNTVIAPMGATVDAFLGFVDEVTLDQMKINRKEVEEVIIVPISEFKTVDKYFVRIEMHPTTFDKKMGQELITFPAQELGLPDKYTKPWGEFKYPVYVYKTSKGIIWGITARFIHDVICKLEEGHVK